MRIFIDTNVVLDLLAVREPFFDNAVEIFSLAREKRIDAVVASLTFATSAYILQKRLSREIVAGQLRDVESLVTIATVDKNTIVTSIAPHNQFADIEDAMQYEAARQSLCDCIVTRNKSDFKASALPVYTPEEFLTYYLSL